jgi:pantetheine-phosphate adenylyltransferase
MKRVGMFSGTFDPVTLGHLDVLRRALRLFDRVVVAVAAADKSRKPTLFSTEERVEMFRESLPQEGRGRVEVTAFQGLLVDFARRQQATAVVRGMRFVSDFEYEMQMAQMNQKLYPELITIFLTPSEAYSSLNATLVKEVALNGGSVRGLVPPGVARRLRRKLATGQPGS